MSDPRPDPGPPPEQGIVVRAEEDGFYVRLQPSPTPPAGVILGVVVSFGAVGGVLALLTSDEPVVQMWVALGSVVFGVLLWGFSFGQGFFPLEVRGDGHCLSWSGERYAWPQVGSCVALQGRLELRGPDGSVLASADHLQPDAARWVAAAVMASLPESPQAKPRGEGKGSATESRGIPEEERNV